MNKARKTFAIILLILTLPIWLFQLGIRNFMSFENLYDFAKIVEVNLDIQLFGFDDFYNAGRFLSAIAGFAKFFEAFILIFSIAAAIFIIRNHHKPMITFIPGCILLLTLFFNLFCIVSANIINNIDIIETVTDLLF